MNHPAAARRNCGRAKDSAAASCIRQKSVKPHCVAMYDMWSQNGMHCLQTLLVSRLHQRQWTSFCLEPYVSLYCSPQGNESTTFWERSGGHVDLHKSENPHSYPRSLMVMVRCLCIGLMSRFFLSASNYYIFSFFFKSSLLFMTLPSAIQFVTFRVETL